MNAMNSAQILGAGYTEGNLFPSWFALNATQPLFYAAEH